MKPSRPAPLLQQSPVFQQSLFQQTPNSHPTQIRHQMLTSNNYKTHVHDYTVTLSPPHFPSD